MRLQGGSIKIENEREVSIRKLFEASASEFLKYLKEIFLITDSENRS